MFFFVFDICEGGTVFDYVANHLSISKLINVQYKQYTIIINFIILTAVGW